VRFRNEEQPAEGTRRSRCDLCPAAVAPKRWSRELTHRRWVGDLIPAGAEHVSSQRAVPHAHGRYYSHSFRLLNHLCADFLNSVTATDRYSLSNTNMGSDARGGITQSGSPGSYSYAFKANMGDKPMKGRKASGAG